MKSIRFRFTRLSLGALCLAGMAGCGDSSYEEGYDDGLVEGYETGYNEGVRDGTSKTTLKYESQWGLTGLGLGTLLGGGLVALLTRRYLAERYRAWSNRKQVSKWVGQCEVELDDDINARVVQIGRRKQRLEEELEQGGGRLVAAANVPLIGSLSELDDGVLKLATLMQQLRNIRNEVGIDPLSANERVTQLRGSIERAESSAQRAELEQALAVERQKLSAAERNQANLRRCEMKLDSLHAFLDRLIMEIGNMRTLEEQGAFEQFEGQVGQELDQLRQTYEKTLSNLLDTDQERLDARLVSE